MREALGLSPREFGVALGVLDGQPVRGIATELECSPHTVDTHLRRIYRKLALQSRAALAARMLVAYVHVLADLADSPNG